ncbi:MAG: NADP-dependent oxidoreductase [Alphaproteobacteria bacterium]|nr:NADP-dependent oxidoreductase [Alphaproteobacteria bacterium]MBU1514822.1 NADP-dependent oxidoreductase [Alphaproteobacteria bacterium]MBU2093953.1 NADP-dependent oxidoreductase [Alphaproteobacteria bacterium]MBU2153380.1 NADP-dependent oxidoreductase [Alphaproteobacteria bacterium]MBU2309808.1 NADP-dependent oxidoreductase [Alphaproteobacteria bacterium]
MNRYWTLAEGPLPPWPQPDTFELREEPIPTPADGQALTRTIYVSLDPYQWGYKKRGVEPAGGPCHARTVSQVVESRMAGLAPGDLVFNTNGWAEYGLMGEGVARPAYMIPRKLDPAVGRISQAVGVLGMLGLTAYAGMILMAEPKAGETVVVSAASGGVGQIAGQLARLRGARVVGIAGREDKCRFVVDDLGFDACVSHLSPTFPQDLAAACPAGVDVYFENVGGAVFDAVLPLFNTGARMTICGLIAHYGDADGGDARADLMRRGEAIFRARGVKVGDLFVGEYVAEHQDAFLRDMAGWVAAGEVRYLEDIREGLETVPLAFAEMLRGGNFGKMLVRISADPTL